MACGPKESEGQQPASKIHKVNKEEWERYIVQAYGLPRPTCSTGVVKDIARDDDECTHTDTSGAHARSQNGSKII